MFNVHRRHVRVLAYPGRRYHSHAHLYSFGQTSNLDMSVNNSATTFIFAFRDPEAGGESLLGTAQVMPEVVSAPSAGNRNEEGG